MFNLLIYRNMEALIYRNMEALVLIKEVGAYSERQYQRQDGTTEYFKSRGVVLKHGGDEVYGELTGEYASKQRDTQFYENQPYVAIVKNLLPL